MMQAYRVETTLTQNGELRLAEPPFRAGARVEVIVLAHEEQAGISERYPLRGTPYRYDDPFELVAAHDWEVLQ
jgi:hypothetical protein